jgi:hypothetical protein
MRYLIIEVSGDNEPLHQEMLADLVIHIMDEMPILVSDAWVQENCPEGDPALRRAGATVIQGHMYRKRAEKS